MDTTLRILPTPPHGSRAPVTRKPGRLPRAILACALLSLALGQAEGRPGDLDPSFDADGKVLTHFDGFEEASSLVAQPDGKIVAAGTAFTRRGGRGRFALARYLPDGQLDRGFGRKGLVRTGFAGRSVSIAALAIQIDTKLVAAGSSASADGNSLDFVVARYNPDGSLDPSFGSGGQLLTDLGSFDSATALAVQPDGKIVVAGESIAAGSLDFALVRYNPDGTLDAGFGSGGRVLTDFGGVDAAKALVLLADGKLVAAGSSNSDIAVARYNPDGSLDPSFGSGGQVLTDLGSPDQANALALQPDGKIVVAGTTAGFSDFALVRYNPDGSLDAGFGSGGSVVTNIGSIDAASALALQPDGKLVVAGISAGSSSVVPRGRLALLRYNADGTLDPTFGTAGIALTSIGRGLIVFGQQPGPVTGPLRQALALQVDGKVVAVSTSEAGSVARVIRLPVVCLRPRPCDPAPPRRILIRDTEFALTRYLGTDERTRLPPKCGGQRATILGTTGNDTIRGTAAKDVILGRGGNDTIRGLEGDDIICGGPGNDTLLGNEGGDRLLGESGNDRLFGDAGGNTLDGGSGRDSCTPNGGSRRCETPGATRPRDPPKPTPPTCSPVTNVPCVER